MNINRTLILVFAFTLMTGELWAQTRQGLARRRAGTQQQRQQLQQFQNPNGGQAAFGQSSQGIGGFASNTNTSKYDAEVEEFFEEQNLPGIVVLMARDGQLIYRKTMGFADVENQVPVSEHSVFRLASVSKWVAGMMAFKLSEQGRIDLNAKTNQYLPQIPAHHTSRVKDLVTCRGGIRHYGEPTSSLSPAGWSKTVYSDATSAASQFWNDPLAETIPDYHYSTHGYTLLGACFEAATGKTVPQLVNELISGPSNLSTLRCEDLSQSVAKRVKLYVVKDKEDFSKGNQLVSSDNLTWKFLGGGLESSALDLLRLGSRFCDKKVVSNSSVEKMMKRIEWDRGYTYGVTTAVENGNRVIAKNGGQRGASTYIWMVPDKRMVMVVLINRQSGGATSIGKKLRGIALASNTTSGKTSDLVVEQFKKTGPAVYRNGKLEIPVQMTVKNIGTLGVSTQFVNAVKVGTRFRWTSFMEPIASKGTRTATGIVKIPDANKMLRGRTVKLIATADAPIAAADTSISSSGRVSESSESNNLKQISFKVPGGFTGGFSSGQPQNSHDGLNQSSGARRTNGTKTAPGNRNTTGQNRTNGSSKSKGARRTNGSSQSKTGGRRTNGSAQSNKGDSATRTNGSDTPKRSNGKKGKKKRSSNGNSKRSNGSKKKKR